MAAAGWTSSLPADVLSKNDLALAKSALKAIDAKKWRKARNIARDLEDPAARKLFEWMQATGPDADMSFEAIADFMAANPDWPSQKLMIKRAEEAISVATPAHVVLDWFAEREPVTSNGMVRLGEALLDTGRVRAGRDLLRRAWIEGNFGSRQARNFLRRHRKLLTSEDHWARLDRLAWEGRYWPAKRMLQKVNKGKRALAWARLTLRRKRGGVDRAIKRVPAKYKNHPGLVYERMRWRMRKGRYDEAVELLPHVPDKPPHPELWWKLRADLARFSLAKGYITEAYRLARDHHLTKGAGFADGEWMAGWIALRFLNDTNVGLAHFKRMFEAVNYPVSKARGAYWTGRAFEASGERNLADVWYRTAAAYPTTYYGQLAAGRLGQASILLPAPPDPTQDEIAAHARHEVTRAAEIMVELKRRNRINPFIEALMDMNPSPGWQALTASLAKRLGRTDSAIRLAKVIGRNGTILEDASYPVLDLPPVPRRLDEHAPEPALSLAVIRQESLFKPDAKSRVGARGLMQLMPRTAKKTARKLRVRYSRKRLTADPDYNMLLGQTYLGELLEHYQGSYVLALTAYNAGSSRVTRWINHHGHPRDADVDVVDWVEMIPFDETRNYVQRVLENLQIYRARLGQTVVARNLVYDLER